MSESSSAMREAAALAVKRILYDGAYTEIVIDTFLKKSTLNPLDGALFTAIVNETVKMKRTIDHLLSSASHIPPDRMESFALSLLRTACAQLVFFDRLPAYAVINDSVGIAGKKSKKLAGFINAVLRKTEQLKRTITYPDLCTELSYENWMADRWTAEHGAEFAAALMRAGNENAGTAVRVNRIKANYNEIRSRLSGYGYEIEKEYEETGVMLLKKAYGITGIQEFIDGKLVFQDEAAARDCLFLAPSPGDKVLDLCAAPGGKSFLMSQLMQNKGSIAARDKYDGKLKQLYARAKTLGIKNIAVQTGDAEIFRTEDSMMFDKVLADVPCSGTGIIRKKPEIKWNRKPEDIKALAIVQAKILKNAYSCLRPGGELVYSTCSLEPEENTAVIHDFLSAEHSAILIPYSTDKRFLSLFPHIDDTDGFFAAKIRKEGKI